MIYHLYCVLFLFPFFEINVDFVKKTIFAKHIQTKSLTIMIVSNNQFIIKANSEKLRKEADRALIQAFIDNKQKKDFKDFVKFVLNGLFNFNRTEGKRKEQN